MSDDDELDALYEALRVVLESKMPDFDGDVTWLWSVGEPESAIFAAFDAAIAAGIPVPLELHDRARALGIADSDSIRDDLMRLEARSVA